MPRSGLFIGLLAAAGVLSLLHVSSDVVFAKDNLSQAVTSCESLRDADLTDLGGAGSSVTKTENEQKYGVSYCVVSGTLAPAIQFQVELPAETWSERFLQAGCGGLCGRVSTETGAADGCDILNDGTLVIAGTDMGHDGMGGDFGKDPGKRADFAYRGVHLTALAAKKLISLYYGRGPAHSYFSGCSDGGREAVMEAQRYPDDFDGIIAGAAAMSFQTQNGVYHAWQAVSNTGPDGKAILTGDRLPILHKAVLAQCDGLDGLVDGLIGNPTACKPDLAAITCPDATGTDTSACLTPAEVTVAQKFYDGPADPVTGRYLTAGGSQPGTELAWEGVSVPPTKDQPIFSSMIAMQSLQNLSFEVNPQPDFTLASIKFDEAYLDKFRALHPFYDATNPDLSPFVASGGKLILWHGLADPHISPITTIAYYQAVEKQLGSNVAKDNVRLYLFPGMYHCSGGEGPSRVDLLTPMINWVEKGQAPFEIIASQPENDGKTGFGQPGGPGARAPGAGAPGPGGPNPGGPPPKLDAEAPKPPQDVKIVRTRPVYPYPQQALYDGKGDPNAASSFKPDDGRTKIEVRDWAGADFFTPYAPKM